MAHLLDRTGTRDSGVKVVGVTNGSQVGAQERHLNLPLDTTLLLQYLILTGLVSVANRLPIQTGMFAPLGDTAMTIVQQETA